MKPCRRRRVIDPFPRRHRCERARRQELAAKAGVGPDITKRGSRWTRRTRRWTVDPTPADPTVRIGPAGTRWTRISVAGGQVERLAVDPIVQMKQTERTERSERSISQPKRTGAGARSQRPQRPQRRQHLGHGDVVRQERRPAAAVAVALLLAARPQPLPAAVLDLDPRRRLAARRRTGSRPRSRRRGRAGDATGSRAVTAAPRP